MRTIGRIGGMRRESSAGYYRLINQGMKARKGGHCNARSIMVTVRSEDIQALQDDGRWDELGGADAESGQAGTGRRGHHP